MSSTTTSSCSAGSLGCYSSLPAHVFCSSSSTTGSSSSSTSTASGKGTWAFPETIIDRYNKLYPYNNPKEKAQLIEEIAKHISSIYAHFLTVEQGHQTTGGLIFIDTPKTFPGSDKVNEFQECLRNRLVKQIKNSTITDLSVKHLPEKILDEVLKECGFSEDCPDFRYFFPRHSFVSVTTFKKDVIHLWMRSGNVI